MSLQSGELLDRIRKNGRFTTNTESEASQIMRKLILCPQLHVLVWACAPRSEAPGM
jgi:hypothetical protein